LKAEFFLQVSGGFTCLIEPVAARLGIVKSRVYANMLLFDDVTGMYKGFDYTQPTSESGGKARACETILRTGAHRTLVMVGDGATDMEAVPPAHAAIGFGGNVVREAVGSPLSF
jgi:phosphoserine phosphatase